MLVRPHCAPATPLGRGLRVIPERRGWSKPRSLLDFAGPPAPKPTRCDLGEVVAHAVELIRARARQQRVQVEMLPRNGPAVVHADRGQLSTVLLNLLLNALDAMPRGGRLEVGLETSPGGEVTLTVRDTGSGIPPEMADRLFTPFASSKPTGTGLGLSISRHRRGPRRPDDCGQSLRRRSLFHRHAARPQEVMPTLLIVDDEPGVLYSFDRVFASDEVRVLTASTGAAGETLFRGEPDVVVLDLQLPDRSGLDVFMPSAPADPSGPLSS
jgi:hypothetical protein